jgi:antitoxin component of MazEF toxin-antitoxin module
MIILVSVKAVRLRKLGNSLGVLLPIGDLRALGWWQSDELIVERRDNELVLKNFTQHTVRPIHTRKDYGDRDR